jgi:hypothetical protein
MPSARFEPVIPATKRPQTYSLDRAATGTKADLYQLLLQNLKRYISPWKGCFQDLASLRGCPVSLSFGLGSHLTRHGGDWKCVNILVGKPEGQRPFGRLTRRWEDVMMMIMSMGWDHVSELRPPTGLFVIPQVLSTENHGGMISTG